MKQSGMPEDTAEKIFEGFSQESSKCFLQKYLKQTQLGQIRIEAIQHY
jgi:hypothetical protein